MPATRMRLRGHGQRTDVVRVLRAAPQLTLLASTRDMGTTGPTVQSALAACRPRGRCAQLAADAVAGSNSAAVEAALASDSLSPAAARAAEHLTEQAGIEQAGVANWSARDSSATRVPRRAAVACGASTRGHVQATAGSGCPPLLLQAAHRDIDWKVRAAAITNPAVTAAAVAAACEDDNPDVRAVAALHPATPADILKRLTGDEDHSVRAVVAANSDTPVECLDALADDAELSVRANTAQHPECPARILRQLAGDENSEVRAAAAKHPALTPEVVLDLCADSDSWVSVEAATRENLSAEMMARLVHGPRRRTHRGSRRLPR